MDACEKSSDLYFKSLAAGGEESAAREGMEMKGHAEH